MNPLVTFNFKIPTFSEPQSFFKRNRQIKKGVVNKEKIRNEKRGQSKRIKPSQNIEIKSKSKGIFNFILSSAKKKQNLKNFLRLSNFYQVFPNMTIKSNI